MADPAPDKENKEEIKQEIPPVVPPTSTSTDTTDQQKPEEPKLDSLMGQNPSSLVPGGGPPAEGQPTTPPTNPPPTEDQPKKKLNIDLKKGIMLGGLLILLLTFPIAFYFITQSGTIADIRNRAAYPDDEETPTICVNVNTSESCHGENVGACLDNVCKCQLSGGVGPQCGCVPVAGCGLGTGATGSTGSTGTGAITNPGTDDLSCDGVTGICTSGSDQDLVICYCDEDQLVTQEQADAAGTPMAVGSCAICEWTGGGNTASCLELAEQSCQVVQLDITEQGSSDIIDTIICYPPDSCTPTVTDTVVPTETTTVNNTNTNTPTPTTPGNTNTNTPTPTLAPAGCNLGCSVEADCETGYVCSDTTDGFCRNPECIEEESCECTEVTGTNTPTPLEGQCDDVRIYRDGNLINPNELRPGDQITIAVVGTYATKARIRINGGDFIETEDTNGDGEYIFDFTIPNAGNFVIEAEVFVADAWR
ncbi:hypothetical protein ACFL1P_00880 [Patescibacteria group bacterium]